VLASESDYAGQAAISALWSPIAHAIHLITTVEVAQAGDHHGVEVIVVHANFVSHHAQQLVQTGWRLKSTKSPVPGVDPSQLR
jgi:hypothetical protein